MDKTHQIIINVAPQKMPILSIETNCNNLYTANLSYFKNVHCFPKTQSEWENVNIAAGGFNLTWTNGFEVHIDQIIAEAKEKGRAQKKASG